MYDLLTLADDPVRLTLMKALASYAGIAALVVALVGGLKKFWKTAVDGKEPFLALGLTFVLGVTAKLCLADVYGPNTVDGWAFHAVALFVVAILGKGIHDAVWNPLVGKSEEDKK